MEAVELKNNQMVRREYCSEAEAAAIIGKSEGTLRNWRLNGRHSDQLQVYKFRNSVFYKMKAIRTFQNTLRHNKFDYPQISLLTSDGPIPGKPSDDLLSTSDVTSLFGISSASLAIWRSKGLYKDVLPHINRSGVFYEYEAVVAFLESGRAYFKQKSKELGFQILPRK